MKKPSVIGMVMLLVCSFIWGTSFVAQSEGMKLMEPFTFQAVRSLLGGTVLIPFIIVSDIIKKRNGSYTKPSKRVRRRTLLVGMGCGVILCVASCLQQFGMAMGTDGGKAGFITALYILIVPLLGLLLRKKVRPVMWGCIALGIAGLYLLCIHGGFTVEPGDGLVMICAVIFAVHIVMIDIFVPGLDGVKVSCIQFFTSAVLSGICMFIFESPSWEQLKGGWFSLFYAGVMSCGIAYTLQILGQQRTEPTVASLLMSFESVFAVLGTIGFSFIMGEPQLPTAREWAGCALMFSAIILSQLPLEKFFAKRKARRT